MDYHGCSEGDAVSGAMFTTPGVPSGWLNDQPPSAQRIRGFAVTLIVDPGTEPLDALAETSLWFEVRPAS
jgi:hypothetical protein